MDFDGSSDGAAGSFIPSQMIAPMADEPRVPYNRSLKWLSVSTILYTFIGHLEFI
jgi:hypothetical protein